MHGRTEERQEDRQTRELSPAQSKGVVEGRGCWIDPTDVEVMRRDGRHVEGHHGSSGRQRGIECFSLYRTDVI